MTAAIQDGDLCPRCGHLYDDHEVWASATGDPRDGGVITCPHCNCTGTWSLELPDE
jgi:hypothetical protein